MHTPEVTCMHDDGRGPGGRRVKTPVASACAGGREALT
jgi:hypothetical protein